MTIPGQFMQNLTNFCCTQNLISDLVETATNTTINDMQVETIVNNKISAYGMQPVVLNNIYTQKTDYFLDYFYGNKSNLPNFFTGLKKQAQSFFMFFLFIFISNIRTAIPMFLVIFLFIQQYLSFYNLPLEIFDGSTSANETLIKLFMNGTNLFV